MSTAPDLLKADPKEYFKYPACAMCRKRPCNDLRFGAFRQGDFLLVHNRDYATADPCPFAAGSFEEVEYLLNRQAPHRLDMHMQALIGQLTPSETMRFNQDLHGAGGSDCAGRVEFLQVLWDAGVFSLLRMPVIIDRDEKLKPWINAWDGVVTQRPGETPEETPEPEAPPEAADTTGMEIKADLWDHTDESIKDQRPKQVAEGDIVRLSVATKNIPDGETVLFKVYNVAGANASTLETLEATINGGRAEAQWTVKKDEKQDTTELEWDAVYKGVESGRGKIELKTLADLKISLQINPDDPDAQQDTFILYSNEQNPKYKQEKTVKDDADKTNDTVDLIFTDIDPTLKYTLEVNPGGSGPNEIIFQNRSYGDWIEK